MKKKLTTLYLEIEQWKKVKQLSASTKVPMSVYMREGIEIALNKYRTSVEDKLKNSASSQANF
jgi:predicted DNA-binding protein